MTQDKLFWLDIDTLNLDVIENFESFLRNEYTLYEDYKTIYDQFRVEVGDYRKMRIPQPRGVNTINSLFKLFRSFLIGV